MEKEQPIEDGIEEEPYSLVQYSAPDRYATDRVGVEGSMFLFSNWPA